MATLLVAAVLFVAVPAAALAVEAGVASTSARTATEVQQRWAELKPRYSGSPYVAEPRTDSPYATGSLGAGFVTDGLNMLNFGRFLAGLPDDVSLDPARATEAQYGAVLLAAAPVFSHEPEKPAGMEDDFYAWGRASTESSNIGLGYDTSAQFQLGCLADDDPGNLPMLGHRRWLLNPAMAKTGIGFANARNTTYAFDSSRSAPVDYKVIAYPPAGPFPADGGFLEPTTPWSITLNPSRYDWDATGHVVTLRRVADGSEWEFSAEDKDTSGEYFNFDTQWYGVANCFIFRPDPGTVVYRPGDEFEVTLSGGIYAEGTRTPAVVTYRTQLISLTGSVPVNSAPVGADDSYAVNAGVTKSAAAPGVLANDSDRDPATTLTAALLLGPTNGTLDLRADGSFSYMPRDGYLGDDLFTYRASDGVAYSTPVTVRLTVAKPSAVLCISGPSSPPAFDGSGTLTARLLGADGTGLAERTVIFERLEGTDWVHLGTVTTGPTGSALQWFGGLRAGRTFRARFTGCTAYAGAADDVRVLPKAKLVRTSSWKSVSLGRTYAATGYIAPKHRENDANKVRIRASKLGRDGQYHYVKSFPATYTYVSSTKTAYRAPIKFSKTRSRGMWKLQAYHAADSGNAKSYGAPDYVRVN